MGKINELAISDSNVNMNIVEKYGTFRLQSDKQITENGKHTADVGFNGLSSVNVNVSGGGDIPTDWYLWQDDRGYYCYLPFETAPDTLDSMEVILIGDSSIVDTELVTRYIGNYTKNSDTGFTISYHSPRPRMVTYTKVTEDVPIGGGGATELYCWYSESDYIYTTTPTPSVGDKVVLSSDSSSVIEARQVYSVTEEGITLYDEGSVFARFSTGDVNLV